MKITICSICHKAIEPIRAKIGLEICISCASKHVKKYKGDMNYSSKTAPTLMVMSAENFQNYRRYVPYGKYTGRGSGTHKMTTQLVSLK